DIETIGIFNDFLEIVARIWSPDANGYVFFRDIGDGDVKALIFGYAAHVMEIARTSISAVDHTDVVSHADCGEVSTNHAFIVEEVGLDAFSDIGIAAELGIT